MAAWPEERIRAALSSQAATLEKILADQTIVPQQALGSTHVVHDIIERVLTTGHQADAEKSRAPRRSAASCGQYYCRVFAILSQC